MPTISFRFFIVPLGAVCTLVALGLQDAPARADRDASALSVRQQVIDCTQQHPSDVCVLSGDRDLSSR